MEKFVIFWTFMHSWVVQEYRTRSKKKFQVGFLSEAPYCLFKLFIKLGIHTIFFCFPVFSLQLESNWNSHSRAVPAVQCSVCIKEKESSDSEFGVGCSHISSRCSVPLLLLNSSLGFSVTCRLFHFLLVICYQKP